MTKRISDNFYAQRITRYVKNHADELRKKYGKETLAIASNYRVITHARTEERVVKNIYQHAKKGVVLIGTIDDILYSKEVFMTPEILQ